MKKILTILFLLISILANSQDTPPTGVNFKTLPTYSFKYYTPDSTVWMYKGSTYNWTKLNKPDLSLYRKLTNHDSLSTLDEKSYNSLNDKPDFSIYRRLNDHDSLSTLQEKNYSSLAGLPDLTIYRRLNNHDSLSTLQERSYNSLTDKPELGTMVYPGVGIALSTGSAWSASITDNSSYWNTAYTDRMKWDGGSTGLMAATGRTSLGLGTAAQNNTGDFVAYRTFGTAAAQDVGYFATAAQGTDARTPISHNNTYHSETYITSAALSGYATLASPTFTGSARLAADAYILATARFGNAVGGTILVNNGTGANFTLAEIASNKYSIGYGALAAAPTPVMTFDMANGYVGIGTITPTAPVTVAALTSGINQPILYLRQDAANDYGWKFKVDNVQTGNIYFQRVHDGTETAGAVVTYTDYGNVGIGTTAPSQKLEVNGVITATSGNSTQWNTAYTHSQDNSQGHSDYLINNGNDETSGTLTASNFILSSDKRLKKNIRVIDYKGVNIEYKKFELKAQPNQIRYGVIAQDLQKTNPELVREDENGMLSVAYIDLLIKEIASLKQRVTELEKANDRQVKRDLWFYKKCKRNEK